MRLLVNGTFAVALVVLTIGLLDKAGVHDWLPRFAAGWVIGFGVGFWSTPWRRSE